jgi:subtilase family serine protease
MRLSILATIVLTSALASSPGAFAQGQGFVNSPAGWEAHPPLHVRPDASTSPVGYVPQQISHAYGFDLLTGDGTGQIIAIVDAYGSPTAQNDLNVFSAKFSLPAATIQFVGAKTGQTNAGWALETSLDLQWAHALAPKATIILAVAKSASLTDLLSAVDAAVAAKATVVSMSWGSSEFSSEANYESHFQKTGVTFLASSGDSGSGYFWPAASPSVVSVGGTSLYLDATGNAISPETAWSGSGGGLSKYFLQKPTYQQGWQPYAQRAYPDVSLVADPNTGVAVYDTTKYNGLSGWFQVGGTSASAPMWGAVIALANQQRTKTAGGVTLNGSNAAIYKLAGTPPAINGNYFFDVKSGSNGGYTAIASYDEVTGLGTPIVPNVALDLGK